MLSLSLFFQGITLLCVDVAVIALEGLTVTMQQRGPPDSAYANGEFYGVILFPADYPFKPPGIKMITPSGRFQPDKKICFSMSDFHPGSWNPAWSVATM